MAPTTTTRPPGPALSTDQVWRILAGHSFAVVSHVTPHGEPRSSGVLYTVAGRRLYVVIGVESWKARHLSNGGRVAVTVPVRRGGPLALLFPIPPATITFHGTAVLHDPESAEGQRGLAALAPMIPAERRSACRVLEISAEGRFLTYGIGVSLSRMRAPELARAHVPVR